MGMSGEATWRNCILTPFPDINQRNTSSLEPESIPIAVFPYPLNSFY